jgi:hypothetical protein
MRREMLPWKSSARMDVGSWEMVADPRPQLANDSWAREVATGSRLDPLLKIIGHRK